MVLSTRHKERAHALTVRADHRVKPSADLMKVSFVSGLLQF
jgi:hypothetical protein